MTIVIKPLNSSKLITDRLMLRPLRLSDAPRVKELAGNLNVSKTTRSIPHPYEDGMAESWIKSTYLMADTGESLAYAIQLVNDDALIGSIGLIDINNSEAVLGFWVGESYWRLGYCTEAVKAIIDFAFNSLGLKKITAEHLTYNLASGKVMKKAGMFHIGTVRKECRIGEFGDIAMYEIIHT